MSSTDRVNETSVPYHSLLAARADSGELLHTLQPTGKANTTRGASGSWMRRSAGSAAPAPPES